MIDVVCLKWGAEFGPEYVTRLRDMVARNLTAEHRFHCLTDNPTGLDGIHTIELPAGLKTWFGKVYLFSEAFHGFDDVLYFDLDTVIVDNIDFLARLRGGKFQALQGFGNAFRLGSAVMRFTPHDYADIWTRWQEDPGIAQAMSGQWGDGQWIQLNIGRFFRLQDEHVGKFVSFKWEVKDQPLPDDAAVVCFHGRPRPHEVEHLDWMRRHWLGELEAAA